MCVRTTHWSADKHSKPASNNVTTICLDAQGVSLKMLGIFGFFLCKKFERALVCFCWIWALDLEPLKYAFNFNNSIFVVLTFIFDASCNRPVCTWYQIYNYILSLLLLRWVYSFLVPTKFIIVQLYQYQFWSLQIRFLCLEKSNV